MKQQQAAKSIVLEHLKPLRHSFGLLYQDSIVQQVEWHQHHEYELLYMEQAYGTFLVGDHVFSFDDDNEADLLLFFGKHLPHSFHYPNNNPLLPSKIGVYSLIFTENCFGEHFFETPELHTIKSFLHRSNKGFFIDGSAKEQISQKIKALHKKEGVNRVIHFLEILKTLENSTGLKSISGSASDPNQAAYQQERIQKIIQFVYSNYDRELSVRETAHFMNMSEQSFRLYFQKSTGQTFLRFLNQLRISKVCEALLNSEMDITTIAFSNGFNNLSNFNRRFKQIKGISPREFKKLWKNEGHSHDRHHPKMLLDH